MSSQILAGVKKDFWSFLTVPLAGWPAACKIANINLFSELTSEKTVLVFGTYDLVFCYQKGIGRNGPVYDSAVVTRTFTESISLIGSGISGTLSGTVEVRAKFSRPLRIHIRPGRLTNLKMGDFIKSLLFRRACVEIQVESEIAAEITLVGETVQKADPAALSDSPPEGAVAAREVRIHDPEELADLVAKILRQREEKRSGLRGAVHQERERAVSRPGGGDPGGVKMPRPDLEKMDLGQIPSRPGLSRTFVQNAPPSRPPGPGG
ncbi:MAG: hypothetical protein ACOY40_02890 [Bacillota bacterium]